MANMTASTVAQYLAALPADRRAALSAVRKAINENLPAGYEEGMQFGMIGWYVPLSVYPAGYGENPKVPLPLVALASQKSGMVLHFLCFYGHPTLRDWFISEWGAWERATWTEKPRGSGERVGRRANQFIAKCGDSLREIEESAYWLELLVESGVVSMEKLAPLRQECDELTAIFVTILKRAKTS